MLPPSIQINGTTDAEKRSSLVDYSKRKAKIKSHSMKLPRDQASFGDSWHNLKDVNAKMHDALKVCSQFDSLAHLEQNSRSLRAPDLSLPRRAKSSHAPRMPRRADSGDFYSGDFCVSPPPTSAPIEFRVRRVKIQRHKSFDESKALDPQEQGPTQEQENPSSSTQNSCRSSLGSVRKQLRRTKSVSEEVITGSAPLRRRLRKDSAEKPPEDLPQVTTQAPDNPSSSTQNSCPSCLRSCRRQIRRTKSMSEEVITRSAPLRRRLRVEKPSPPPEDLPQVISAPPRRGVRASKSMDPRTIQRRGLEDQEDTSGGSNRSLELHKITAAPPLRGVRATKSMDRRSIMPTRRGSLESNQEDSQEDFSGSSKRRLELAKITAAPPRRGVRASKSMDRRTMQLSMMNRSRRGSLEGDQQDTSDSNTSLELAKITAAPPRRGVRASKSLDRRTMQLMMNRSSLDSQEESMHGSVSTNCSNFTECRKNLFITGSRITRHSSSSVANKAFGAFGGSSHHTSTPSRKNGGRSSQTERQSPQDTTHSAPSRPRRSSDTSPIRSRDSNGEDTAPRMPLLRRSQSQDTVPTAPSRHRRNQSQDTVPTAPSRHRRSSEDTTPPEFHRSESNASDSAPRMPLRRSYTSGPGIDEEPTEKTANPDRAPMLPRNSANRHTLRPLLDNDSVSSRDLTFDDDSSESSDDDSFAESHTTLTSHPDLLDDIYGTVHIKMPPQLTPRAA